MKWKWWLVVLAFAVTFTAARAVGYYIALEAPIERAKLASTRQEKIELLERARQSAERIHGTKPTMDDTTYLASLQRQLVGVKTLLENPDAEEPTIFPEVNIITVMFEPGWMDSLNWVIWSVVVAWLIFLVAIADQKRVEGSERLRCLSRLRT